MKSYLTLAYKELKAQKVTAVLILTAIILSTIMTTAIGQSMGILQHMRIEQASSLNGDRYATFHQLTEEQMLTLSSDPRLFDAGSLITAGSVELADSGLTLFLREYLDNALDAYTSTGQIKEGRLPAAKNEIALPEDSLKYLGDGIGIGDQITVDARISLLDDTQPPYQYSARLRVCGILESDYAGYDTGMVNAIIGRGTASLLLPDRYLLYSTDFKTNSIKQFQSVVYDLAKKLDVKEQFIQYNWILLDALGIDYDEAGMSETNTGFSFMAFACILVGFLVLLAAGLVIYNILKIAVTKRIREYGTLRAIGSERGQLYRLVSLQLLILCGIGIPIGLLAGMFSAKWILTAATGLLNPDLLMAESTSELNFAIRTADAGNISFLLLSVGITLIFAMLAAFPAARYAARVSPTVAMSGQTVRIKRHGRIKGKIRNFEAYYAKLNLKRSGGRTVITILSLVMSITVFVALQSFTGILDTSQAVKDMHFGDYALTNETIGMDAQQVENVANNEDVERMATTKLSVYLQEKDQPIPLDLDFTLQSWESFQIAAIDDLRLSSYTDGLSDADIEDLLAGDACLVKNSIPFSYEGETVSCTNFNVGDVITVNGRQLRVVGLADMPVTINNDGYINGKQIIVTDQVYDALTGQNRFSEVYPILNDNADFEQFEQWLDDWCQSNSGSHWLSYRQTDAQMEESFAQINMLCWGLILFIGLIGLLNIINTVYSNIHTRIAEIGMQRAIGMSAASLIRTFLWEGAYYGIIASLIGGVLGYVCTIFVNAASTDTLQLVAIPSFYILEAAVISIAACLLATAIPLRSILKMNVVEAIEVIE